MNQAIGSNIKNIKIGEIYVRNYYEITIKGFDNGLIFGDVNRDGKRLYSNYLFHADTFLSHYQLKVISRIGYTLTRIFKD